MHVTINRGRVILVSASIALAEGSPKKTTFKFHPLTHRLFVDTTDGHRLANAGEARLFSNAVIPKLTGAVHQASKYKPLEAPRATSAALKHTIGLLEGRLQ